MLMLQLLAEMVATAPAVSSAQHSNYDVQLSMRTKQKRHNSLPENWQNEMRTPFRADWLNPCGGAWNGRNEKLKKGRMKKTLGFIKKTAQTQRLTLRIIDSVIDLAHIRNWSLHEANYSFLSTLKVGRNYTLRDWHRQFQVYAAAFGYLQRVSLQHDQQYNMYASNLSQELRQYKSSARNILCEIEGAINTTTTTNNRVRHRAVASIKPVNMLKRLKFKTNYKAHLNAENGYLQFDAVNQVPNITDLMFVKCKYLALLRRLAIAMKNRIKKPNETTNLRTVTKKSRLKKLQC